MTDQQGQIQSLQEEICRLHQQLMEQDALASIGALVPGVTHEVNTPLGVSVTSLSYIQDEMKEVEQLYRSGELTEQNLKDYFNTCHEVVNLLDKNLRRATQLIQSFKSIAANQAVAEISDFALLDLLRDVSTSLRHETKRFVKDVSLECDGEIRLVSDAGALIQVLSNLLMNTIRHGFDEGADANNGRIDIRCQQTDGLLTMMYEDNGKGIDSAIADKIFEPYFTTRRGAGGTGLGLSIARELMTKRLAGEIQLNLEVDAGAGFILTMPLDLR